MTLNRMLVAICMSVGLMYATAAGAAVTFNTTLPGNPGDAGAAANGATNNYLTNQTGTVGGVRRSPWEGTSTPDGAYHSVQAGGSAEYTFTSLQNFLSIMWGSPDDYNRLELFDGTTSVRVLLGMPDVKPNSTAPSSIPSAGFANVVITGEAFNRVVLTSGLNAFEYSKLVTPIPAAGLLFLSALGGLAWVRRLRSEEVQLPAHA